MIHLDLFSGIGGFSLGFNKVGIETKGFCEIDEFCVRVLNKNFPGIPIYRDISKLTGLDVGFKPDIISGGFPCQDISIAGLGNGIHGERSSLWFEMRRLIAELKPSFVVIENVPNLRNKGLSEILKNLWEIGYDAEWNIISASAFGAPHKRERLWIIAYSKGMFSNGCNDNGTGNKRIFKEIPELRNDYSKRFTRGWSIRESAICRMDDGVSDRMDRLKSLGNSVYPPISEYIGKCIVDCL